MKIFQFDAYGKDGVINVKWFGDTLCETGRVYLGSVEAESTKEAQEKALDLPKVKEYLAKWEGRLG